MPEMFFNDLKTKDGVSFALRGSITLFKVIDIAPIFGALILFIVKV